MTLPPPVQITAEDLVDQVTEIVALNQGFMLSSFSFRVGPLRTNVVHVVLHKDRVEDIFVHEGQVEVIFGSEPVTTAVATMPSGRTLQHTALPGVAWPLRWYSQTEVPASPVKVAREVAV